MTTPAKLFRMVWIGLACAAITSAAIKTKQKPFKTNELVSAVRDSLRKDAIVQDTVFMESGFTIDPRKSDSARVRYLSDIGYFDTLRVDECHLVLVPKSVNRLVKERIDHDVDSLLTYESLKRLKKDI